MPGAAAAEHVEVIRRLLAGLAVVLATAAPAQTAAPLAPALGLHVHACTQGKARVAGECGTFGVYENRAAASGRIIALRVAVLKAKRPTGKAIFFIAGGPGESSVQFAPDIADGNFEKGLTTLRDSYDIVFVDERGMGDSNPSRCDAVPRGDPAAYFGQIFPAKLYAACRQRYSAVGDPNFYNTANAVDDLDDIRAALGYSRIVLSGGSYGTYTSLIYVRRHPEHVESALLNSASPPHFGALPGEPAGAQVALDDLIARCRRDGFCSSHFPQFAAHFYAVLGRFKGGFWDVRLPNVRTKTTQVVPLAKQVFVDELRHVLYDPDAAANLPFVVERAYRGDTEPLARMMNITMVGLADDLDMGAFLSYTCAEEIPFLSEGAIAAAAAHSYAGDLRIRAQQQACANWKVAAMPASFNDPVRSAIPMLVISGSDDPATPPRYATEALAYLPNARQLIVKGAGHVPESPCIDALTVEFVRAGSARDLDLAKCAAVPFKLPPFKDSTAGWPQL